MSYTRDKELMFIQINEMELTLLQVNPDSPKHEKMRNLIDLLNQFMRSADSEIYKAENNENNVRERFRGCGTELKNNWNRR